MTGEIMRARTRNTQYLIGSLIVGSWLAWLFMVGPLS